MKIARLFITMILLLSLVLGMSGCAFFNRDMYVINLHFDTELPGYSKIEILKREGRESLSDPRVLTLQFTMEVFPGPIIAEAQLSYAERNPTISKLEWFSLEGAAYDTLVSTVQDCLETRAGSPNYFYDKLAFVLKYWVDKKLIKLDDIGDTEARKQVDNLINTWDTIPYEIKNTPLIDVTQRYKYDLHPEVPENEKYIAYGLRADGTISAYLTASKGELPVDPRKEAFIGIQAPGQNTISPDFTYFP
jgi:hypothetical protein